MLILIIGLIVFLGVHSIRIFAPDWREVRIAAMGENRWKGIYSLVSILSFILLVYGYWLARPEAEIVYVEPLWGRHLASLLMLLSFLSLMVFQFEPGKLKPMLKHPMLIAIKLWALAHLLANGDLASVVMFGSFLIWAIVDRISVKRRNTPLPVAGPIRNDIIAIVAGVVLWALFVFWAHAFLMGVRPF